MRSALFIAPFISFTCFAQQPQAKPPEQPAAAPTGAPPQMPPPRPVEWTISVPTELGLSTGFDNNPGDVTVSRLGTEIGVGIPIGFRGQLNLGFEYEFSHYDFNNATGFIAGTTSPFEDIHRETLRARYGRQEDLQWSWFAGGSISSAAEDGADFGQSLSFGALGGVGYNVSEHLKVGGVLAVNTQLEDPILILPLPILDWQIDQAWRLTTAGKPGLTLYFTPSEQWTFSFGGWYETRNFRLASDGPVPDGVGRERGVPFALGATFRANKNISIDVGAGVRFFSNYQIDDSSSNTLADIDSDPRPFFTFQLNFKF